MTNTVYGAVKKLTPEEYEVVWNSEAGRACVARLSGGDGWGAPLLQFAEISVGEQVTYRVGTPEARDATYMAQRLTESPNWDRDFIFSFHPTGDITVTRIE